MSTAKKTDIDYVREYLRMQEALRDIQLGCVMMQPFISDGSSFSRFTFEIHRVAAEALNTTTTTTNTETTTNV
jgi:hypothetical protein